MWHEQSKNKIALETHKARTRRQDFASEPSESVVFDCEHPLKEKMFQFYLLDLGWHVMHRISHKRKSCCLRSLCSVCSCFLQLTCSWPALLIHNFTPTVVDMILVLDAHALARSNVPALQKGVRAMCGNQNFIQSRDPQPEKTQEPYIFPWNINMYNYTLYMFFQRMWFLDEAQYI